jgi:hypothetical protein
MTATMPGMSSIPVFMDESRTDQGITFFFRRRSRAEMSEVLVLMRSVKPNS